MLLSTLPEHEYEKIDSEIRAEQKLGSYTEALAGPLSVFRITQSSRTDHLLTEGDGAMDTLHTALRLQEYLVTKDSSSPRFAQVIPAADAIAPEVFREHADEMRQDAGRMIAALDIDLDRGTLSTMAGADGWQTLGDINHYIALINQRLDSFIEAHGLKVATNNMSKYLQSSSERILPLHSAAAQCKGKKAVAIVLPSGERVETSTWRKAAAAIMRDCDSDPQRHEMLMELREHVPCRFRQMLSGTPKGMDAPLKINDNLYLESKFDTEALLTNLTQKILRRVGYDYGNVMVLYRDRIMEIAAELKQEEPIAEPEQDEASPRPPD